MIGRRELFIGGKWVAPVQGGTIDVESPATEQIVGSIAAATSEDVDLAVKAARASFKGWAHTPAKDRAVILKRIAEGLKNAKKELAKLESLDAGKASFVTAPGILLTLVHSQPLCECEWDMDDAAFCFELFADQAVALEAAGATVDVPLPDDRFVAQIKKTPLGVVGLITPWNYPLLMAVWKVAPGLAAGCTLVLKPSEYASCTCQALCDIAAAAGLPAGCLNLITGLGPEAGAPLSAHAGVDKVAFTGSLATGKRIMQAAAANVVPVVLELGGKSPIVVFDDAVAPGDAAGLDRVVEWLMMGCFFGSGQVCSATSRVIVQKGIAKELLARLKHHAELIEQGDPLSPTTRMGALINAVQYQRVTGLLAGAIAEGATVLTGGRRPDALDKGYFIQPTVLTNVTPAMTIWREEVFGPVIVVHEFSTEEEAIALSNDSQYGLGSAVMSLDPARCARLADAFESGICWVNCSQPSFPQLPWGGVKRSGFGRELGPDALQPFLSPKQILTYVPATQFAYYPSFSK